MSLKNAKTALEEMLEAYEEYADECDAAGRRQEAESVRASAARAKKGLAEIKAVAVACQDIVAFGCIEHASRDISENTAVDAAAALVASISEDGP